MLVETEVSKVLFRYYACVYAYTIECDTLKFTLFPRVECNTDL